MHDVDLRPYSTVIREMTWHENDVTNHRIMWLMYFRHLVANGCPSLLVTGLLLLGACTARAQTSTSPQEVPLPTESDLSKNPGLATDWANHVMAKDPRVRETAQSSLVQEAGRSLPLLRRFLN